MADLSILLFDGFETLDAFGPAEIFGKMPQSYTLGYYSLKGGTVISSQQVAVQTLPLASAPCGGVFLVPGGMATRTLVDDAAFIAALTEVARCSSYLLSVCTGSALLAKAGLLDGLAATSNKMAFSWTIQQSDKVLWQQKARWVVAGKIYTSSGVSAGMDMALGFIEDLHGKETALKIARLIEYRWNEDKEDDPFAEFV